MKSKILIRYRGPWQEATLSLKKDGPVYHFGPNNNFTCPVNVEDAHKLLTANPKIWVAVEEDNIIEKGVKEGMGDKVDDGGLFDDTGGAPPDAEDTGTADNDQSSTSATEAKPLHRMTKNELMAYAEMTFDVVFDPEQSRQSMISQITKMQDEG